MKQLELKRKGLAPWDLEKDFSVVNDAELIQCLANCISTQSCMGHTKGSMNERYEIVYREELKKRNVTVPSKEKLKEVAIYNGAGSW